MPVILLTVWSWVSSFWGAFLLPLLSKIPWQVWAGLGLVVAFLWYGHVRENRGVNKCEAAWVVKQNNEIARQREASDKAVKASQAREALTAQRAQKVQEDLDETQRLVDKLKEANQVCLPASITKRYTGSGRVRNHR